MPLFRSVSLFGLLPLAEVVLLRMFSLITTSYIINTKNSFGRIQDYFFCTVWVYIFSSVTVWKSFEAYPATRNKWTSGWDGNWFYCRVPLEQKPDSSGQRTYPLSSKMTKMNYLTEVPSSCGLENTNVVAFIEATSLIGGRVVMEEFLASDLWPLGQQFGFQVERKEPPLSKVLVPMP
jgi:hypothetical protein